MGSLGVERHASASAWPPWLIRSLGTPAGLGERGGEGACRPARPGWWVKCPKGPRKSNPWSVDCFLMLHHSAVVSLSDWEHGDESNNSSCLTNQPTLFNIKTTGWTRTDTCLCMSPQTFMKITCQWESKRTLQRQNFVCNLAVCHASDIYCDTFPNKHSRHIQQSRTIFCCLEKPWSGPSFS